MIILDIYLSFAQAHGFIHSLLKSYLLVKFSYILNLNAGYEPFLLKSKINLIQRYWRMSALIH